MIFELKNKIHEKAHARDIALRRAKCGL